MPRPLFFIPVLALLTTTGSAAGAQLTTPSGWRWRLDRPAQLVTGQDVPDSAWRFVGMPPGWHVTTGPGVVLFNPAERASGRYSLSADFILFPDPSESPFGLVLGGTDLDSPTAALVAVQMRRDGAVRILSAGPSGERILAPWRVHAAVNVHAGTGTVTNVLRVSVGPDSLRVFVNDSAVVAVEAFGVQTEGQFGFQIGARLNLHVTTLDVTRHLAPRRP